MEIPSIVLMDKEDQSLQIEKQQPNMIFNDPSSLLTIFKVDLGNAIPPRIPVLEIA